MLDITPASGYGREAPKPRGDTLISNRGMGTRPGVRPIISTTGHLMHL